MSAVLVGNVVNFCNKHVPLTGHIVNLRIKCERIDSILRKTGARKASDTESCEAVGERA